MILLSLQNIHKTFYRGTPDEVHALNGIDFSVEEGSFVMIVGTNGSGKSTLFNVLGGEMRPDSGLIQLDGRNITSLAEHRRAKWIGRVFQNPFMGTAPDMTIIENLALAAHRGESKGFSFLLTHRTRNKIRDKVATLHMGLENRMDSLMGTLSGGQRQALTLLMATLVKPRLLLLDEHTAALDPKSAHKIIELTHTIIQQDRITTVMVTHSMQQAVEMGDRLIMMHKGGIAHEVGPEHKKYLKPIDLLTLFDDLKRKEQMDETVSELLAEKYI